MTIEHFSPWLLAKLQELDRLYDHPCPDVEVWTRCAHIAHEAGDLAAKLGLPHLHQGSLAFGAYAQPPAVKTFLAECLAGIPATPKEPPALLPVEAVADILAVSPSHVYRLADGGKMPRPVKIGSLVRWVRTEIESWIAGGCKSKKRAS